jgi:hypothetical protein
MNMRTFLATVVSALFFFLGGTAVAHAQSCQNQGCQRPSASGNPNCYTCVNVTGHSCSLSGTCPQSCTEGSCNIDPCLIQPGSPDCCAIHPTCDGCPNPCIFDPNAAQCCGEQIVCQGFGCDGILGSGSRITGRGCVDFGCFARLNKRSYLKEVAALLPRKASVGSCQAASASLPKKLLFSL